MIFESKDFSVQLYTVNKLSWNISSCTVHPRKFNALVMRLKGDGYFEFTDGTTLHTKAGEILFCPEGLGYNVSYSENEIIVFHFAASGIQKKAECFTLPTPAKLISLFNHAYNIWNAHKPGYDLLALSVFYEILSILESQKSMLFMNNTEFINAVSMLEDNFCNPDLLIPDICRSCYISEASFRRLFSRYLGTTPVHYLNELRIRRAEQLLLSSDQSIESIALSSGFNDVKYFSRVVKQYRNCTPSELRMF